MDPIVKSYLMKKNGLPEEEFGDEALEKVQADAEDRKSGLGTAQFLGGIGDAIAGRSSAARAQEFDGIRKGIDEKTVGAFDKSKKDYMANTAFSNQQTQFDNEQSKRDPNSPQNVKLRASIMASTPALAKNMGENFNQITVDDYDYIMKPHQFAEQIKSREQNARIAAGARIDAANTKNEARSDKKKGQMFEIEDRRTNINAALSTLDKMIEEDGTWEMFGSQNQDIDRLTEQIATDMAKLMDPNSVARPAEVESIKKTLVRPGFSNKNSTAKDVLNNFKGEVQRRADGAYKIRGLETPKGQSETKVVDGVTFVRVPGGWDEVP